MNVDTFPFNFTQNDTILNITLEDFTNREDVDTFLAALHQHQKSWRANQRYLAMVDVRAMSMTAITPYFIQAAMRYITEHQSPLGLRGQVALLMKRSAVGFMAGSVVEHDVINRMPNVDLRVFYDCQLAITWLTTEISV